MDAYRNTPRFWLRSVQFICTCILIFILWKSTDWNKFTNSIMSMHRGLFWLATLLTLTTHGFNIIRWKLLVLPNQVPFKVILRYYGAGIFSNNFLPTGIGGDGVRVALISRYAPLQRAIWSVAADRIIGLIGLLCLGIPGFWFGSPPSVADVLQRISVGSVVIISVVLLLGAGFVWWRVPRVQGWVTQIAQKFIPNTDRPDSGALSILFQCYLLSLLSALCLVLTHHAVLLAFGLHISMGAAIWLVVMGSLSMLIPITVNGLGVMESVYVLVLSSYDVSATDAIGVVIAIRALILIFSLLGGLGMIGQNWLSNEQQV